MYRPRSRAPRNATIPVPPWSPVVSVSRYRAPRRVATPRVTGRARGGARRDRRRRARRGRGRAPCGAPRRDACVGSRGGPRGSLDGRERELAMVHGRGTGGAASCRAWRSRDGVHPRARSASVSERATRRLRPLVRSPRTEGAYQREPRQLAAERHDADYPKSVQCSCLGRVMSIAAQTPEGRP